MHNPMNFFTELFKQPTWVIVWVSALALVNMFSVLYWDTTLGKVILVVFLFQAMLMMGMYSYFGFEKILGIGHFFWFPLLVYIYISIQSQTDAFQMYLYALSFFIAISLVFDVSDVIQYFRGKKSA